MTPFAPLVRCDGCEHNHYSAPAGQAWNRNPHSRCRLFKADIPLVLDDRKSWIRSEQPDTCPEKLKGRR